MSAEENGKLTRWDKWFGILLAIPSFVADSLIVLRVANEPPVHFLLAIGLIGLVFGSILAIAAYVFRKLSMVAKISVIAGFLGFTLLAILLFIWFVVLPEDPSRYGFERPWYDFFPTADTGFVPNLEEKTRGIIKVERSVDRACMGRYSLKATADLEGGHYSKGSGETYVKITTPADMDMRGKTITACVYAPSGAGGDPRSPNGFQLFVKDKDFRNHYSAWVDIAGYEEMWLKLTLTPGVAAYGDVIDEGFDPTQVLLVGVKIGIGEKAKEGTTYRGPIHIDAVNW
jgi:hypothetical protein